MISSKQQSAEGHFSHANILVKDPPSPWT